MQCPALILDYSPPVRPGDVVSIDFLQLPVSDRGSKYLLVCVDHLSWYIALASLKYRLTKSVAHSLVTHLFCARTTPRVLLSDNETKFRNQLLEEISKKFGVKHGFIVSYHPAINGLVERTNRKILELFRPVVGELLWVL